MHTESLDCCGGFNNIDFSEVGKKVNTHVSRVKILCELATSSVTLEQGWALLCCVDSLEAKRLSKAFWRAVSLWNTEIKPFLSWDSQKLCKLPRVNLSSYWFKVDGCCDTEPTVPPSRGCNSLIGRFSCSDWSFTAPEFNDREKTDSKLSLQILKQVIKLGFWLISTKHWAQLPSNQYYKGVYNCFGQIHHLTK